MFKKTGLFIAVAFLSAPLFAKQPSLNELIKQLSQFQRELSKEGAVSNNQEREKLTNQLELLNLKRDYLDALRNLDEIKQGTTDFYKKLLSAYFYGATLLHKHIKYYFPFADITEFLGKKYLIVGENEYDNLINQIAQSEEVYEKIKTFYYSLITKKALKIDDINNFLDLLREFVKRYPVNNGIEADFTKKDFLSLKEIPCKIKRKYRNFILLKRCSLEK
jgi:hypothetical protein